MKSLRRGLGRQPQKEGVVIVTAALRTDVGRVRKQNEDAAWLNEKQGIYVVADGMGGHLAGEVASAMAIDAMKRMAEKHEIASIAVLREAVLAAHEARE